MLFSPLLLSVQATGTDHDHLTIASAQPPPSPPAFSSTECSRQHMVEAVKASSHCQPMVKVVKLYSCKFSFRAFKAPVSN